LPLTTRGTKLEGKDWCRIYPKKKKKKVQTVKDLPTRRGKGKKTPLQVLTKTPGKGETAQHLSGKGREKKKTPLPRLQKGKKGRKFPA